MTVDPFERERDGDAALWTGAALVVAALHVVLAVAFVLLKPAHEGQAEAPVIDVAFMPAASAPAPAASESPPADPAPRVEQSDLAPRKSEPDAAREAVTEPEPPPVQTEPAPPPRPVLQVPEPAAEPAQPDQVAVMPPVSRPATVSERPAHRPAADEKAAREQRKPAPPKPAAAPGARPRLASAPNSGADSEGAQAGRASWQSELAAHLRRYATYAANGSKESGTVRVAVTIDRNGRLLSRRLAGSSGSSMLDNAAMAVVERAQPYPRFPPGMTQAQVALIIPLHLRPQ